MIQGIGNAASVQDSHRRNQELKVYLTFLNLLDTVNADDDNANHLVRLVEGDVLCNVVPANKSLAGENATSEESQFIQRQILRFLQSKDKYAALASVLLKSRAFHSVYKSASASTSLHDRTPVDLPRTQHKKPYIPVPTNRRLELKYGGREEDMYPISLSHQHPFVGIAQLDTSLNHGVDEPILVGLDIVVFDAYNPRLYSNEEEFLEVFKNSFTDREWSLIQAQSVDRLQEFYIRWSMKEAYTKALGVGMGIDFSSFDIILDRDIDKGEAITGVFTATTTVNKQLFPQRGTVEMSKHQKAEEYWDFTFIPLYEGSSSESPRGCACVCAGPRQSTPRTQPMDVHVEWTDLSSLIQWHRNFL